MTSGEIRGYEPQARQPVLQQTQPAYWLREIAAQLAEISEKLSVLADPNKGITTSLAATNDTIPVRLSER